MFQYRADWFVLYFKQFPSEYLAMDRPASHCKSNLYGIFHTNMECIGYQKDGRHWRKDDKYTIVNFEDGINWVR